jgi:hypothetical protein
LILARITWKVQYVLYADEEEKNKRIILLEGAAEQTVKEEEISNLRIINSHKTEETPFASPSVW